MTTIKIILADDHTLVRQSVATALSAQPGLEVVGECSDGLALTKLVLQQPADVILMDISMPIMNGFVALDKILQQRPDTKVIALSMHEEAEYINAMEQAGARGYLRKDTSTQELVAAIKRVVNGAKVFPTRQQDESSRNMDDHPLKALTRREREVFFLVVAGNSTKEIADKLSMSAKTAENHRGKVLKKLAANNTVELIHFAARHGLLEP